MTARCTCTIKRTTDLRTDIHRWQLRYHHQRVGTEYVISSYQRPPIEQERDALIRAGWHCHDIEPMD